MAEALELEQGRDRLDLNSLALESVGLNSQASYLLPDLNAKASHHPIEWLEVAIHPLTPLLAAEPPEMEAFATELSGVEIFQLGVLGIEAFGTELPGTEVLAVEALGAELAEIEGFLAELPEAGPPVMGVFGVEVSVFEALGLAGLETAPLELELFQVVLLELDASQVERPGG